MEILRTPDERFVDLPDFPFAPHYLTLAEGASDQGLRLHYLDEGPPEAAPVVMLHGEPSWSYLYRHMVPGFVEAGYRALAPDLIGFGRSDKPARQGDYSYERHVRWIEAWLLALDLTGVTLVCQDWGGLIGLRLVADHPERFARVVVANTMLPVGGPPPLAFRAWRAGSQLAPRFPVGSLIDLATRTRLSRAVRAAYDAPFPSERFKAGARVFPRLVPTYPDHPATAANRRAWQSLERFDKPFLTAFSDGDPITRGGERAFQRRVPGAAGRPHTTIRGAGHFLQEDKGRELASVVLDFIASS